MLLYDFFNNYKKNAISEMAFTRSDIFDKVNQLEKQITIHLIKIKMYSNSQYVNHWFTELNSWFNNIQNLELKNSNKPLSYNTLYELLFLKTLSFEFKIKSIMNNLSIRYYNLYIDEPDVQTIQRDLEYILYNICNDISNKKFKDIRNYI